MGNLYRVQLVPIEEEDLEYSRLLRNKFRDFFFYKQEITPEQQFTWWNKYINRSRDEYTLYIVVLKDTGERIGTTSLTKIRDGLYEFGNNAIDTPYQGKGYFREVYQLVLGMIGNNGLMMAVDKSNTHAQDVYRKFGLFECNNPIDVVFTNRILT